jgi:TRAP-type C4-dicarboxylate transport system substrate-binding protein
MVALSYQKRKAYEIAQPQFWKYAPGAEEVQAKWFEELLDDETYIILVAISGSKNEMLKRVQHDKKELKAFIIGRLIKAPEVYNPGGLTLMIDDFCVASPELWETIGSELVAKIKEIAKEKGATQILVVSGDHDKAKNSFLEKACLTVASRWYVTSL